MCSMYMGHHPQQQHIFAAERIVGLFGAFRVTSFLLQVFVKLDLLLVEVFKKTASKNSNQNVISKGLRSLKLVGSNFFTSVSVVDKKTISQSKCPKMRKKLGHFVLSTF